MNRTYAILKSKAGWMIAVLLIGLISFRQVETNEFEITKNFEIYKEIYSEIYQNYVDEHEPGDLMKRSIDGLLESLDPYTNYIPESDIEDYKVMTTGQYGGIGALIRKMKEATYVTEPYQGFPAQKAGLQAGDKLLEIDGVSLKNKSSDEVSKMLKGAAGTKLKIKYEREGTTNEVTLTREEIKIPDVPYSGMVNDEVGYIKLTSFTHSAADEVKEAYNDLKGKGMKKLIFDLRGNGGGLLLQAVRIVNFFVPQGQEVVKQKGRAAGMSETYIAREEPLDLTIPLVVLVDEGSASASEIVSGSLQDLDRAIIVGEKTYGKGLVQQTRKMPYNTMVKLTVAKYYTPSGRCIQKLDYSTKKASENAQQFADSLIKKYKTKSGREVFDARGIDPEITVREREFSKLAVVLVQQDLIFEYATEFKKKYPTISEAKKFSLTDEQYNEFLAFLKDKDLKYKTSTETKFEEFKKVAEKEKYYADAQKEFDAMFNKIKPDRTADLKRFQPEITELLENEIIARYYFQNGRYEVAMKNDEFIREAAKVLGNPDEYKGILNGTIKRPDPEK